MYIGDIGERKTFGKASKYGIMIHCQWSTTVFVMSWFSRGGGELDIVQEGL